MPRQPRQMVKGETYHVINRGNNRQTLFSTKEDFESYLKYLSYYRRKHEVDVYHYCLMNNHAHHLMRSNTADDGISRLMHDVQTVFASYYNKKNNHFGHPFEGRFKDLLIDTDAYFLECGRYIERNPVRAGLVEDPGGYPWSSYAYYADGKPDPVLTPNPLYLGLDKTAKGRRQVYRRYVKRSRAYEQILDRFFDENFLVRSNKARNGRRGKSETPRKR